MLNKISIALVLLLAAVPLCAQPVISTGSAVNAADYSREIAPGSIIVIFGQDLAPEFIPASRVPLPTELGGTSVELTDGTRTILLPLFYVMASQVACQVPYDTGNVVAVRILTPGGASDPDSFTIVPTAGKFFSVNQEGFGRAVALDINGKFYERKNPVFPGQWLTLYGNSMGAVDPPIQAGAGAGDGRGRPLNKVTASVSVDINGRDSKVDYAGLVPFLAGAYQINVFTPYFDLLGDIPIRMTTGESLSQLEMTIPAEPNGEYYVYAGSKFPNGQTKNAIAGPGSAIVFRHEDTDIWGDDGFKQWTTSTPTTQAQHAATSGLALTLMNGDTIVYDNNGIEDGTFGTFYDNGDAAVGDNEKPGLWEWYENVNDDYAIFAGYFKLTAPVTFTKIIGYFDDNGRSGLRFDPDNVYNTYRMNIWSNGAGDLPAVSAVVGDVFSSSTTPGVFSHSQTAAARIFSDGARDNIHRMVYTLETPITLPAGEYWFGHDLMVPKPLTNPLFDQSISSAPAATKRFAGRAINPHPDKSTFVGR